MKVLGISGSPRRDGNSMFITGHALKAMAEEGIETELVSLSGFAIAHCDGCFACMKQKRCIIKDDLMPLYDRMVAADGIVLTTPVYFSAPSSLIKAFMDRTGMVALATGKAFKGKVGGPLVVGRRGGLNATLSQMTFWFQLMECYMAVGSYWGIAFGKGKGEVAQDKEGLDTAWSFGKSMSLLMKATRR